MKGLNKRFKELNKVYSTPINFGDKGENLEEIIRLITPKDDSALVWSDVAFGLSDNPQKTLEKLYGRYVSRYDHKKVQHRRTDNDVWRCFKKDLSDRRILNNFKEKVI